MKLCLAGAGWVPGIRSSQDNCGKLKKAAGTGGEGGAFKGQLPFGQEPVTTAQDYML